MTDHPTPPPAAQTREPGFYWVNIPESGWYAARLAVIESGPVIDGILVADANERVEIWVIPGQPFGTTDIAGWEIGPRIPTPAERAGDAALVERLRAAVEWARHEIDDNRRRAERHDAEGRHQSAYLFNRDADHLDAILAALTPSAPGSGTGWLDISTAPKSTAIAMQHGSFVRGVYLLGYCPEEGADPAGCIEVIWWEPNESGGKGCWYNGFFEVKPTHWRPLPAAPTEDGR